MTHVAGAINSKVRNRNKPNFIWCDQWFMYQRILVSEIYPDFPNEDIFRIYLFLCKHFNQTLGKTRVAKSFINKQLKYSTPTNKNNHVYSRAVDHSLVWLENKGFIKKTSRHAQAWYECKILKVPDYVQSINDYHQNSNDVSNWYTLKEDNSGYSMIPAPLFSDDKLDNVSSNRQKWTKEVLKTLIILYAHNWLEYYGGINPEILSVDRGGRNVPSNWLCSNLDARTKDVKMWIAFLRKEKLLQPVECYFTTGSTGTYYGDVLCCTPPPQYEIKTIFRPTYLITHKRESEAMRDKKVRML